MSKPIIWSYGGGVQSIALAILIAEGRLPIPDRVVFADTMGEMTEVWDYMCNHVEPLLGKVGCKIEIASHGLAKVDFYRTSKAGKRKLLIPAYTRAGKLPIYCSKEWKTLVVRRHIGGAKAYTNGVIMWLGMSVDEIHRLKPADAGWIEHHWPLCDMPKGARYGIRMNRVECRQLILDYGLPDPPRSACVWCPNLDIHQIRRMKEYSPQDFNRAIEVGKMIYENDQKGGVWQHKSRQFLDEIDLENSQLSFEDNDEGCDSGHCWT
jgi:hypothetical protein